MKKKHAFLFLYLFCSSILFGQIDNKSNSTPNDDCNEAQVQVSIVDVIWNANVNTLYSVRDQLADQTLFPIDDFFIDPAIYDYASAFHIVVLKFQIEDEDIDDWDSFDFDLSANSSYNQSNPIVFMYAYEGWMYMTRPDGDNYTLGVHKELPPGNHDEGEGSGGGVITTAGVMGRSGIRGKISGPPIGGGPIVGGPRGPIVGSRCMNLEVDNRSTNDCASPQPVYLNKCTSTVSSKVENNDTLFINSYPNPVRNHLFVETDGLDVRAINLLNLQGQSLNHQVNVSHTESIWQINTSKLEAGLYILQVETDAGLSVKKVYVQ